MKYTAREGGGILKEAATNELKKIIQEATLRLAENRTGFFRMFSAKHEFSGEWHRFLHPNSTDDKQNLSVNFTQQHFPFQFRRKTLQISMIEVFMLIEDPAIYAEDNSPYAQAVPLKFMLTAPAEANASEVDLLRDPTAGGLPHGIVNFGNQPKTLGLWKIEVMESDISLIAEELQFTDSDAHDRLKPDAITDLIVVCRYRLQTVP